MSFSATPTESFDLIVVGGGHAGCEAAITAARLGLNTALFTLNLDRIAWQPCNPAVGGPAKSQLVHEVDALGGVIGRLADATAIQKRVLNASRGPAVWALRAQTDKRHYSREMLKLLHHTPNLALREAMVTGLEVDGDPRSTRPAPESQGFAPTSAACTAPKPWCSPLAPSLAVASGWAINRCLPGALANRPLKA